MATTTTTTPLMSGRPQSLLAAIFFILIIATATVEASLPFKQLPKLSTVAPTTTSLDAWTIYSSAKTDTKYNVSMPNSVIGSLLERGDVFDFDPFFGDNMKRIKDEMFEAPWVFETSFALDPADTSDKQSTAYSVRLCFDGINYRGNVTLNGVEIMNSNQLVGALRRFEIDVSSKLLNKPGETNTLRVSLQRSEPSGDNWRNPTTDLAVSFFDWNPHPPDMTMGLLRPVRLVVTPALKQVVAAPVPVMLKFDGFNVHTDLSQAYSTTSGGGLTQVARLNVSFVIMNTEFNKSAILGGGGGKEGDGTPSFFIGVDLGLPSSASSSSASSSSLLLFDLFSKASSTGIVPNWLLESQELKPQQEVRVHLSWMNFPDQLIVENPPLWWPWEMRPPNGEGNEKQPLFNAAVGIAVPTSESNDPSSNEPPFFPQASFRYALRSSIGTMTRYDAFQLTINNVPILVRGGGFAPDMFYRINNRTQLIKELAMVRSMGLNLVRLEGFMMTSEFFDICDEMGIMVTPGIGCCDGWQNWDFWPLENYHIAYESVVAQARRLSRHPSVVIFLASSDLLPPPSIESMYNAALQVEAWPNAVLSSAEGWFSTLTGNSGVKMSGAYSWEPPTYWLEDGSGLLNNGSMNYGGAFGYLTEGGPGESPMTYNSWLRTVPKEDVWSNEDGGSLAPMWNFHMGMAFGHFRNLTRYTKPLDARYGTSTDARRYLYRSQVGNYEGIRSMFEGYSRNKKINATGIIQWQIKMAWPSNLWNLFDNYLVGHGGFHGARKACGFKPIHVMMSPVDGTVQLYHSRFEQHPFAVEVTATLMDIFGAVKVQKKVIIPSVGPDASVPLPQLTMPIKGNALFRDDETFFVALHWTSVDRKNINNDKKQEQSSSSPTTTTTPFKTHQNYYWMSPQMDVLGPWNQTIITWYQTPCYSWANFTQLNSLPAASLSVEFTPYTTSSSSSSSQQQFYYSDAGAQFLHEKVVMEGGDEASAVDADAGRVFTIKVSNTANKDTGGVAFFIQLRLVDPTTGNDITPVFIEDNFFSLSPQETVQVVAEAPLMSAELAERVVLEVESYNNIVAQGSQTAEGPLVMKVSPGDAVPQPPPPPSSRVSPQSPTQGPSSNKNTGDSTNDDKTKFIAAAACAGVLGIVAIVAVVKALQFRSLATKAVTMGHEQDELLSPTA